MSDSAVQDSPQPITEPDSPTAHHNNARTPLPLPWLQVELEYVRGASLNQLSAKYSCSRDTIAGRAKRGKWETKRSQIAKTIAKANTPHTGAYTGIHSDPVIASLSVDLANAQSDWKASMYRNASKLARGIERVDANDLGDTQQTKKLAEAASALASIDATARRQLGLDVQDAEDFGHVGRYVGRPGERHVMRRAQVVDILPDITADVQPTPEAFDPGI